MPKQSYVKTRKISVDLPQRLWDLYSEVGRPNGLKIKDYVIGAFEAIEFFDKLMSELLEDDQVQSIPKMLLRNIEKIEMLYTGQARIDKIGNDNFLEFQSKNQEIDTEKKIITHDIVKKFSTADDKALRLAKLKRKYLNSNAE